MAVSSRGRAELAVPKKWKERDERSPERTKVWTEPKPKKTERKVAVVYYLCRNGHLEHPHFMEVTLASSADGLYLRDVLNRLNFLRGKGMASLYSWSSKRSYKNGFVWHDLCENDFIYPVHGQEYVLKGSELLEASRSSGSPEALSSSNSEKPLELARSEDQDFPVVRRRHQSWSSLDLHEYKVYKADSMAEIAQKAADASTQTDDRRRRRRGVREERVEDEEDERVPAVEENPTTELSRGEISPPQSSPSPETLESLIKAERRPINGPVSIIEEAEIDGDRERAFHNNPGGKMRASAVLMQLISCGSISVKGHGFSLISHYRGRLPRGSANQVASKEMDGLMETPGFERLRLEDKEYFSGSLIETKKGGEEGAADLPGLKLKRSSSYNADRCSKMDLIEEVDGVRAKCIPRKPKTPVTKETNAISRSAHGSKRIGEDPVKL